MLDYSAIYFFSICFSCLLFFSFLKFCLLSQQIFLSLNSVLSNSGLKKIYTMQYQTVAFNELREETFY